MLLLRIYHRHLDFASLYHTDSPKVIFPDVYRSWDRIPPPVYHHRHRQLGIFAAYRCPYGHRPLGRHPHALNIRYPLVIGLCRILFSVLIHNRHIGPD